MKNNRIRSAMDKVVLSDDAKRRIKNVCRNYQESEKKQNFSVRFGMRAAVAAAVLAAMSITAYAMANYGYFSFEKSDDTVIIGAVLSDEVKEQVSSEPVRAWNPGDGEVSVKLNFSYMPEDMSERDNTPGKWYGTADYNRSITFSGFDLRRGELNAVIDGVEDAERFTAGENDAYLLSVGTEISVYNKELYVLFYNGQFVVKGTVGCGITNDEIKAIAAGMSVEETDDVVHALPISNEFGAPSNGDDNKVYYSDPVIVYESDLLSIGEKGNYESTAWEGISIIPLEYEITDTIAGLDENCFHDIDWVKQFTDDDGNFISYKRTGVDYEAGKFTETVDTKKKMILVTVQFDSDKKLDLSDIKAHLNTFNLSSLKIDDNGTVDFDIFTDYVVDRTPGRRANSNESKYIKALGDGKWIVGYLLDEDECKGDFFFANTVGEVYYSF